MSRQIPPVRVCSHLIRVVKRSVYRVYHTPCVTACTSLLGVMLWHITTRVHDCSSSCLSVEVQYSIYPSPKCIEASLPALVYNMTMIDTFYTYRYP